jgi:hypothetical protein
MGIAGSLTGNLPVHRLDFLVPFQSGSFLWQNLAFFAFTGACLYGISIAMPIFMPVFVRF